MGWRQVLRCLILRVNHIYKDTHVKKSALRGALRDLSDSSNLTRII